MFLWAQREGARRGNEAPRTRLNSSENESGRLPEFRGARDSCAHIAPGLLLSLVGVVGPVVLARGREGGGQNRLKFVLARSKVRIFFGCARAARPLRGAGARAGAASCVYKRSITARSADSESGVRRRSFGLAVACWLFRGRVLLGGGCIHLGRSQHETRVASLYQPAIAAPRTHSKPRCLPSSASDGIVPLALPVTRLLVRIAFPYRTIFYVFTYHLALHPSPPTLLLKLLFLLFQQMRCRLQLQLKTMYLLEKSMLHCCPLYHLLSM